MRETITRQAREFLRARKNYRAWLAAFLCLAILVGLGTTAALTLPGITMTEENSVLSVNPDVVREEAAQAVEESTEEPEPSEEPLTDTEEIIWTDGHGVELREIFEEDVEELIVDDEPDAPTQEPTENEEDTEEEPRVSSVTVTVTVSDPEADEEDAGDWYAMFADLHLTGDWNEDLIALAKTQLDYAESEQNTKRDEDGTVRGYTRYGAWYGEPYEEWNALFVSFCLEYTKIPATTVPRESDAARWVEALSKLDLYIKADDHEPALGDLMFFDLDGDEKADRVGIVTEVRDDGIETIEGDCDGKVQLVEHLFDDDEILGYCVLPANPHAETSSASPEETAAANVDEDTLSEEPEVPEVSETPKEDETPEEGDRPVYFLLEPEKRFVFSDLDAEAPAGESAEESIEEPAEELMEDVEEPVGEPVENADAEPTEDIDAELAVDTEEADDTEAEDRDEESGEEDNEEPAEDTEEASDEDAQEIEDTENAEENDDEQEAEENLQMLYERSLEVAGADYMLQVQYDEASGIPEDADFVFDTLTAGEVYESYVERAREAVSGEDEALAERLQVLGLFDLTIYDREGMPLQPEMPVTVRVSFDNGLAADMKVYAVHFPGTGAAVEQPEKPEQSEIAENSVNTPRRARAAAHPAGVEVIEATNENGVARFETSGFSVYAIIGRTIEKTILASDGHNYHISVTFGEDAGIPADADLAVRELEGEEYQDYLARTATAMDAAGFDYARIFDISIVDSDGTERQPQTPVQVSIALLDAEEYYEPHVLHFGDSTEELAVQAAGNTVSFETTGFSVYAVVDAPEPAKTDIQAVMSLDELAVAAGTSTGFYLSYGGTAKYFTSNLNNNNAFIEVNNFSSAAEWYFEPVENETDQFYIYTYVNEAKKYMKNTSGNLAGLVDTGGTAFALSEAASGKFYFKSAADNKWLQHSNGGGGIRFWTDKNNAANSQITITYASSYSLADDPYGLDGKTFGIAYHDEAASAAALIAESKTVGGSQRLAGLDMLMRPDVLDNEGLLLVAENSDITEWTFHNVEEDKYTITTVIDGVEKYLTINGANVILEDTPSANSLMSVTPGTGAYSGKWHITANGYSLRLFGNANNGFGGSTGNEATTWMSMVERSSLSDDDFTLYTARKVSVSDNTNVFDGQQVIIYTRIWNDKTLRYEFYAVDHDGSLVRCYDTGDNIEWIGSKVNTALWDFTEYYYSGTKTPNYYYELQNVQYKNYIAPQVTGGQVMSDSAIGINLNGRRYEENYTPIVAWDDENYAYVGLKTENGHVVACPLDEAEDFYFAVVKYADPNVKPLTTVDTIDSDAFGITMKMVDFNNDQTGRSPSWRDAVQNPFFGGDNNVAGLLSTNLGSDGYPTTTSKTGHEAPLSELFTGMTPVNHLFIESIYNESGYFEYDSTQNFAHLNDDGTFTVYDQLLAVGTESGATRTHGQFLPYNEIDTSVTAPYTNQTDVLGNPLPDVDPRKGEELYWVSFDDVDYFFGMEMEASFTQTASGLDAWGHDIIFEFSGDDDFWLYVDGELVLDLGGVHPAMTGTINFRTGVVTSSRGNSTLYDIFKKNYQARGMTAAEINAKLNSIFTKNANGQYVFRDYTNHTMKMFYMERGAGASNLHMRFNLAAVKPGTFILSKTLSGTEVLDNDLLEFPYQIYYTLQADGESTAHLLTEKNAAGDYNVIYSGRSTPVTYAESYTPAGGTVAYSDVFFLKPGEAAEVTLPDGVANYYVVECGVNPDIYDKVTVNGAELTGEATENYAGNTKRLDFETEPASLKDRTSVEYDNHVADGAMRNLSITKVLYDRNGVDILTYPDDETTFSFRLYLGNENADAANLPLANMYSYHVKDTKGNYCSWDADAQKFISFDTADYDSLTADQKKEATFNTSMNGSISKIPAGYTVEVRDLIIGTQFEVEERDYEIPKGYTLRLEDGYSRVDEGNETKQYTPIFGTIVKDNDPAIQVRNQKGWGLTVEKVWTDQDFMAVHDPIYFAVYVRDKNEDGETVYTLLPEHVRQLKTTESSVYYFFGNLENGIPFNQYEIREVTVAGNYTVDANGKVTGFTSVTPIEDGGKLVIGGQPVGGEYRDQENGYSYDVSYDQGEQTERNENVRTDTVTNSRPGIELYKTDWAGENLAGAVFTLQDENGQDVAAASYTSRDDGLITIAYLPAGSYALTETAAPKGYVVLDKPMTIVMGEDGKVTVSGVDQSFYTIDTEKSAMAATITIKNRQSELQFKKVDVETGAPIEGVEFSLYRQVTTNEGVKQKDYTPITGYTGLMTDAEGILEKVSIDLNPGTYYLTETKAAEGYDLLSDDICFTIGNDGRVTINNDLFQSWLEAESDTVNGKVSYVITVPNGKYKEVRVKKVAVGTEIPLAGASFVLYKEDDLDANGRPKEETEPVTRGTSGDDGVLFLGPLPIGTYKLIETVAPDGYNLLEYPVKIVVRDDEVVAMQGTDYAGVESSADGKIWQITVWNSTGYVLPMTGGSGTLGYSLGGGLLSLTAGLLLALRRIRRKETA